MCFAREFVSRKDAKENNRMHKYLVFILLFSVLANGLFVSSSPAQTAASTAFTPSKKAWKWADKQLAKMSVEEKVGQTVYIGLNAKFANEDSEYFKDLRHQVVDNHIGGIIFFGAPIYETAIMINRAQEMAKIPLLMSLDAETGIGMRFEDATNFPWAMADRRDRQCGLCPPHGRHHRPRGKSHRRLSCLCARARRE